MNDIIIKRRPAQRRSVVAAGSVRTLQPSVAQLQPAQSAVAAQPASALASSPLPEQRKYARQSSAPKPSKGVPRWLQVLLVTVLLVAGPVVLQSDILGQLAVVVYGIIAYARRIPSRTTFSLALIAIITTALFLVVKGSFTPAGNFATYTFLLLSVGVVSLAREIKKEGGRVYSIKNNNKA